MTRQILEKINYEGSLQSMFGRPLDDYFKLSGIKPDFELTCSACWRGYIGTWEILDDRLYLTDLSELMGDGKKNMQTFFPDDPVRVFAYWYSGQLRVPQGERVVHPGFYSSYEHDLLIDIEKGVVQKKEVRENELPMIKPKESKLPPDTIINTEPLDVKTQRRNRLKFLVIKGKQHGYLTYTEINLHVEEGDLEGLKFPGDLEEVSMEDFINSLRDMGITVCDDAPEAETFFKESKAHDE